MTRPKPRPRHGRVWSEAEITYLSGHWGKQPLEAIGKALGRSAEAVRAQARRLCIGPQIERNGEAVTVRQLAVLGGRCAHAIRYARTLEARGLRVIKTRYGSKTCYSVALADFWRWAETHRTEITLSRIPPGALGPEPPWAAQQRKRELGFVARRYNKAWSVHEEMTLRSMARQRRPVREICARLSRSNDAVFHHARMLGLDMRYTHRSSQEYFSADDLAALEDMIRGGASMQELAARFCRSADGLRNKIRKLYGSGKLDAARAEIIRRGRAK